MSLLIRGARLVDPEKKLSGVQDCLVDKGKIIEIAKKITTSARTTVDAKGLALMPGFVDLHVHFRQPGTAHQGEEGQYRQQEKSHPARGKGRANRGSHRSILAHRKGPGQPSEELAWSLKKHPAVPCAAEP